MIKRAVSLALLQIVWATGFSQTLSFKFGIPFRRADLDLRWNVPTNSLPSGAWEYQLLPNHFTAEGISNLVALGGFTQKEKTKDDADWLVYNTPNSSRRLGILFPLGSLEYEIREKHGPTNLVQVVPSESEALMLTTNWLSKLGISLSEIERGDDGGPNFHIFDSQTTYFVNQQVITNTEFRGVRFRRSVDGASFIGASTGGNCEFRFGDHGKVSQISISWRKIERHKRYATASLDTLARWIRQGKAVQNMLPGDVPGIVWRTVKGVTISKAELSYYGGGPFEPSNWLMPFVALWATVDTTHGKIDVEIDCPIIDEN
jgi:hypothetical protein